jgi:Tfp pilus assembly protein PilF
VSFPHPLAREDFSGALSHYQQVITLHPGFAQAYNNMGSALAGQGRFEEAIVHFEQAINFDSHYRLAQKNLELARSLVGKK